MTSGVCSRFRISPGFLNDEVKVILGKLIVFEVTAHAAALRDQLKQRGNAQGRMVKRLTLEGIRPFVGGVQSAAGENQHAPRIQSVAKFPEDGLVACQRSVPDTVPG